MLTSLFAQKSVLTEVITHAWTGLTCQTCVYRSCMSAHVRRLRKSGYRLHRPCVWHLNREVEDQRRPGGGLFSLEIPALRAPFFEIPG